jgi:thiosulfate/3-mercaptopyruvate sulfurtransferase
MTQSFSPLIAPAALAARLAEPGWAVFDCRHRLADHGYGRRVYAEGHLPGARFADTEEHLSGRKTARSGRHPLPDWGAFSAWLGAQGVGPESRVVAYDDAGGAIASRLWFMLRVLGHDRVAVLDGGFPAWQRADLPSGNTPPAPRPARFTGRPDPALLLEQEAVAASCGKGDWLLVDARAAERYRGDTEPIDPRPGHIPGAINLPFAGNLTPEGTFLPPARLRERLLAAYGPVPPERTVHYCGSGVTACHNLLAHAVAGLPLGRLFPGSWSQWCADPARPAALGEAPGAAAP